MRRYTADITIHVHPIVTRHGQSFKTPPAYQTCTREASAAPAASFSSATRKLAESAWARRTMHPVEGVDFPRAAIAHEQRGRSHSQYRICRMEIRFGHL